MSYNKKIWTTAWLIVFTLTLSTTLLVYLLKYVFGAEVAANLFVLATALLSFAFFLDCANDAAEDMIARRRNSRLDEIKDVFENGDK